MDPAALEAKLRARLGDALDARVAAAAEEFGGLLDRPSALLLLADEEGLLPAQSGLADFGVEAPAPAEAAGVVERLSATRTFRRGDGTVGFVCDVDLRTPDGVRRVVLWDEAVRRAQGWQGRAARFTALAPRLRGTEPELHSTRRTEVLPG